MLKIEILLEVMRVVKWSTNDVAMFYNIVSVTLLPKLKKKNLKQEGYISWELVIFYLCILLFTWL